MTDSEKTSVPQFPEVSSAVESGRVCDGSIKLKKDDDDSSVSLRQNVELPDSSFGEEEDVFQRPGRTATFVLAGGAIVILGWWISSIVVPLSRPRWIIQTILAWFFVLVIAFRFIPASVVSRPIGAVWSTAIGSPFSRIPYLGRLALAWLGVLALTVGSAFGFERPEGTAVVDRVISLAGILFFQLANYGNAVNRKNIDWMHIPISIMLQQALAIFVLKSDAGFKIFGSFSTAMAGFQTGALEAGVALFDLEVLEKKWLYVTELGLIIFFAAFVKVLYWFGWMQWLTKHFAWFGARVFGASGAETFVAIWTPWFGQVSNVLLVSPYIESMTDSEIFALMTTSMASMSSLMINAFSKGGATPRILIAQSAILIPGAIMNAKAAFPDQDGNAITRSRASTHAHNKKNDIGKVDHGFVALGDGAWLGLRVAGSVLVNVVMLLAFLIVTNSMSVWIFRGFGVEAVDLQPPVAALITPFTFFLGVPRREVWRISLLICQRLLDGTDISFAALTKIMDGPAPLSSRGFAVVQFVLASSSTMRSMAIQLGAMMALAPARKLVIAQTLLPAMTISTIASYQGAAIAATIM